MIKKILYCIGVVILAFVCVSCDNSPKNRTNNYNLPKELQDCTVSVISGSLMKELYVLRCPNSTTSANWSETCGKGCVRNYSSNTVEESY